MCSGNQKWAVETTQQIIINTKTKIKTGRQQQQQQRRYLNGNERFVMIHLGNFNKSRTHGWNDQIIVSVLYRIIGSLSFRLFCFSLERAMCVRPPHFCDISHQIKREIHKLTDVTQWLAHNAFSNGIFQRIDHLIVEQYMKGDLEWEATTTEKRNTTSKSNKLSVDQHQIKEYKSIQLLIWFHLWTLYFFRPCLWVFWFCLAKE